ncbi:hypothetical protein ACNUI4_09235 [Pseudomonas aeruginosa]
MTALFQKETRRIMGKPSASLGAEFRAELSKLIPHYMDILGAAAYTLFAYRGDNNGNPVYHECNSRELIGTTSTATTQQGVTYAALLTVHTLECSSLNKD